MPILKNISFRVVGLYLRVNETFNKATTKPGVPDMLSYPELDVPAVKPTIGDVMQALAMHMHKDGYVFKFDDAPGTTVGKSSMKLNRVRFACEVGKTFDFELNANDLSIAGGVRFAWQYYLFDKGESKAAKESRIEVTGRASYMASEEIKDNYRIIWRLIAIDVDPDPSRVGARVET